MEHDIEFEDGIVTTQTALHTPEVSLVIPVTEDGNFVLIRQFRHAVGKQVLEFPAGKVNGSESPMECALRELIEETGYRSGNLCKLVSLYASPEFTDELIHVFVAHQLERGCPDPEPYERIIVVHRTLSQILETFSNPAYTVDSKTLAALLVFLKDSNCFDSNCFGNSPGNRWD